jgi:hypothetical protein
MSVIQYIQGRSMKPVSAAIVLLTVYSAHTQAAQEDPKVHPPAESMAPAPFKGVDYSGIYKCKGKDSHEGPYTGIVTLKLVRSQSHGEYGAYHFTLDVPDYGSYPGQAAAQGTKMAITFANTNPATKDYGTGIATFLKNKKGKWVFTKYYYEPEFKGGNFGTETCVQR